MVRFRQYCVFRVYTCPYMIDLDRANEIESSQFQISIRGGFKIKIFEDIQTLAESF